MSLFQVLSLTIVVAALFSFINHRFIGLPTTIGVTLMALVISVGIIFAGSFGAWLRDPTIAFLQRLDFRGVVFDGVLAFLLFAGSLSVDLDELLGQKLTVGVLATVGVVVSTLLVGGLMWALSRALGLGMDLLDSLLFGALISPTDPIAVLGILRATSAPKTLQVQMAGESLFNDGVGVVVFSFLVGVAGAGGVSGDGLGFGPIAVVFLREVVGSLFLGFALGWLTLRMLRGIDNSHVAVLLTLALTTGLYSLATALHMSGPLAVVVAGLLVGAIGRRRAMPARTVEHLHTFWELVDEILNVVLFVLIGFEVLLVPFSGGLVLMGATAVVLALAARFGSVWMTVAALKRVRPFHPHAVSILSWGGLRGGLSLAMALSLPPSIETRHTIQAMTYVVAVFSIGVQGLTFGKLLRMTGSYGAPGARGH